MDENTRSGPHQNVTVIGNRNFVLVAGGKILLRVCLPLLKRRWTAAFAAVLLAVLLSSPTFAPRLLDSLNGKTAVCRDGWLSESHHRAGTCSSHGGVREWLYPASHAIWGGRGVDKLAFAARP
jgi:hypothetical protein